jgi:putative protease
MIRHCHSLNKKLYIAANSLILERELPLVIENLALLQELRPDALIVQDLGLIRLVRHHFPKLKLHGSTLMTAHNSDGVRLQAQLGCERVVLARELTLKEIAAISAGRGNTELEVFIHGAMCFSYSGLCLFSSYLGGKSGLRGRCVQPCRRAYSSGGKGSGAKGSDNTARKGDAGRYLFSMNDLTGLEAVPLLQEAGIASLKIEGRLRSAHYVHSIVGAYRKVLDADPENRESQEKALAEAKILAEQAMSRKTSSGYFFSPQPPEAITPHHSGNMGIHLGRFTVTRKAGDQLTCKFVTKANLAVGDRLRLHIEPSGERTAFRLKSLYILGLQEKSAASGSKVSIELPPEFQAGFGGHVEVYKTDGGSSRPTSLTNGALQIEQIGRELEGKRKQLAVTTQRIVNLVCDTGSKDELPEALNKGATKVAMRGLTKKRLSHLRPIRKKIPLDWWLKTDSLKLLMSDLPFSPDRYLLSFNKQTVSQAGKMKGTLGNKARMVTWALPPLIMENDLSRIHKQIQLLLRTGFRSFQLAHLSQQLLFEGEKAHLSLDYTANLFNNQAVAMVSESGIGAAQAGIEMDRSSLQELFSGCGAGEGGLKPRTGQGTRNIPLGLTVYGAPALYTSRLAPDHFQFERQILSPRDEPYVIRKKEGYTQTFPEKSFSLLPYLDELKAMGVKYVVVDISGGTSSKRELLELNDRLHNSGRYGKLSTFNYLGKLE